MERVSIGEALCRDVDDAELTLAEIADRDARLARARGGRAFASARQPQSLRLQGSPTTNDRANAAAGSFSAGGGGTGTSALPHANSGPLPRMQSAIPIPRGNGPGRRRRASVNDTDEGAQQPFRMPPGVITVQAAQWNQVHQALKSMALRLEEAEARAANVQDRCERLLSNAASEVLPNDERLNTVMDDARAVALELENEHQLRLGDVATLKIGGGDGACLPSPSELLGYRAASALRASAEEVDRLRHELALERTSYQDLRQRHCRVRTLARRLLDKSRARRRAEAVAQGSGGEGSGGERSGKAVNTDEGQASGEQRAERAETPPDSPAQKRPATPNSGEDAAPNDVPDEPPTKVPRTDTPAGGGTGASENTVVEGEEAGDGFQLRTVFHAAAA